MSFWQSLRHFKRDTRLFLGSYFLALFGHFGIYAVIFNLYLLRLGYGSEFVGAANAIGLLNMAALGLPAGWLGKRFGSRRVLIAGLAVGIAALILIPLSEALPSGWQATWILVTYGLYGLGNAMYIVNAPPFLINIAGAATRNYAFSMMAAGGSLAAFLGNLLAGVLPGLLARVLRTTTDTPTPYRYTLLIPPFLYFLSLVFCAATRQAHRARISKSDKARTKLPMAIIAVMALALLLRMVGEQSSRVFFNVHLDLNLKASTALIGGLAAVAQLIAIPAALLMPLFTRLLGRFALFVAGLVGMSGSLVLMAMVPHWAAAGLAFIGIACMHAIVGPTSVVFQQEIVAYEWREVISGATTMAIGIGSAGIAFGGGFMLSGLGYRSLFLAGAVSVALGALIFWLYFRTPRGEYQGG